MAGLLLRGTPFTTLRNYAPVQKGGAIVVTTGKSLSLVLQILSELAALWQFVASAALARFVMRSAVP